MMLEELNLIPYTEDFNWKEPKVGTYILHHRPTRKMYIGSSGDLRQRSNMHRSELNAGKHPNKALQEAYTESPTIDFVYFLAGDRDEAYDIEGILLKSFHPLGLLFNSSIEDPRKGRLGVPMSEEEKQRRSILLKGTTRTPEEIERIRQGAVSAGWTRTEEQRAHLSQLKKGKPQPPHIQALLHERNAKRAKGISIEGVIYPSVREAVRQTGVDRRVIGRRLRSNKPEWISWFFI